MTSKDFMSSAEEALDFGGILDTAIEIAEFGITEKPRYVDAIHLSKIKAESSVQIRTSFDPEGNSEDAEFLESIKKEGGNHEPIWVAFLDSEKEAYKLIAGHRRRDALEAAGIETARALVWPTTTPEDQLDKLTFVENYHRKQLSTAETARALQVLMEKYEMNLQEAAEFLGISRGHAHNLKKTLNASPEVRELVEEGKIGANAGSKLAKLPPNEQAIAASAIKAGKPVIETLEEIDMGTLKGTAIFSQEQELEKYLEDPVRGKKPVVEEIEQNRTLQLLTKKRVAPLLKALSKSALKPKFSAEDALLVALIRLEEGVSWTSAIEMYQKMLRADKRVLKAILTAFEAVLGVKEFSDERRGDLLVKIFVGASDLLIESEAEYHA